MLLPHCLCLSSTTHLLFPFHAPHHLTYLQSAVGFEASLASLRGLYCTPWLLSSERYAKKHEKCKKHVMLRGTLQSASTGMTCSTSVQSNINSISSKQTLS